MGELLCYGQAFCGGFRTATPSLFAAGVPALIGTETLVLAEQNRAFYLS
jgi:hypothetical protein